MNEQFILIIIVILVIAAVLLGYSTIEGFYTYFPPGNCMENVFGKVTCFRPGYFPFYIADFVYPRFAYRFSPWVHGPAFRPIIKKKIIIKK